MKGVKNMRTLLELLRIIFILFIFITVCGAILNGIYSISEAEKTYAWLGGLSVYFLFFVLYRNKLQFSGWYKGEGNKKLPRTVSTILIVISCLLLISPYILSYFLS